MDEARGGGGSNPNQQVVPVSSSESNSNRARACWGFAMKNVNYARFLKRNIRELDLMVHDLCYSIDWTKNKMAGPNTIFKIEFQIYEKDAMELKKSVSDLQKQYQGQGGAHKLCDNFLTRVEMGKRAVDLIDRANQISWDIRPLLDSPFQSLASSTTTFKVTDSFYQSLRDLVKLITEKGNPKIGIVGDDGVGKTSLMELLANRTQVKSMFDLVIWVTVSESWTIKKLQDQVRQCLSIKITTTRSEEAVANQISRLLLGKKYLLLLDDVRKGVDLGVLGFPNPNEGNDCRVVLTTNVRQVCWDMKTDSDIKVIRLPENEAWDIFCSVVGDAAKDPSIEPHAKTIVKMSEGLPLFLKLLGGSLKDDPNPIGWKEFESKLDGSVSPLRLNFSQQSEEAKKCLLYCAFYPGYQKIKKSRVIRYLKAVGSTPETTLQEQTEKGVEIFENLIKISWLEGCEGDDKHVTMHIVVRDLLLKMMEREELEQKEVVSYMNEDMSQWPPSLASRPSQDSRRLVSLLLQGNDRLKVIPESVFETMPKLEVLDLSYTGIKSLPSTISKLTSLRLLLLKDCYFLEELPEQLHKNTSLEVLQVSGAWMRYLPIWISELTSLKYLKFGYRTIARWWSAPHHLGLGDRNCTIPDGVICKLSKMEVFNVSNFMYNFRLSDESVETVCKELCTFTNTTSLHFDFRKVSNLEHFIGNSKSWEDGKLSKFRFIVGEGHFTGYRDFHEDIKRHKRCLRYIGGRGVREAEYVLPNAVLSVLTHTTCFELEGHDKITSLSELNEEHVLELRHFGLYGCAIFSYLFEEYRRDAFKNLESLTLFNLPDFKGIHSSPKALHVHWSLTTNLKELDLQFCPSIEVIFTIGSMRMFNNLEELRIKSCRKLKTIISRGDESPVEDKALTHLKKMSLEDLPELSSIFTGGDLSGWDSLKELCIIRCPNLKTLPRDVTNAAKLREIRGSHEW